jgi:hypothetical protein
MAYCAPRRWYPCTDTCSSYVFNMHMYLILCILLAQRIKNIDLKKCTEQTNLKLLKNCPTNWRSWLGYTETRATACVTSYLEVYLLEFCHWPVIRLEKDFLFLLFGVFVRVFLIRKSTVGSPNLSLPRRLCSFVHLDIL